MMPKKRKSPAGRKLIGEQLRKRYNVSLDPSVKTEGEKTAKELGLSFSMWLENAAKVALETKEKS